MKPKTHHQLLVLVFSLLAISSSAKGQASVQTFAVEGDLTDGMLRLTVEPFDSMNGTHTLTNVGVSFDGKLDAEIEFINYTSSDLGPSDWMFEVDLGLILAFDKKAGFDEGGPIYQLDGFTEDGITGELSAGSGGLRPPLGNPTPGVVSHFASLSGSVSDELESTNSLSYFESDAPLQAGILRFQRSSGSTEEVVDGFIDPKAEFLDVNGTLTISYNWLLNIDVAADCNRDGDVDVDDLNCVCGDGDASLAHVLDVTNRIKGDTDGDGAVSFADFLRLSGNFGAPGSYLNGDLDCDGTVMFSDFLILASNFGQSAEPASHSVPEPTAHSLLLILGIAFGRHRWKCNQRRPKHQASKHSWDSDD